MVHDQARHARPTTRQEKQVIEISEWQLKVCIRALTASADQEKNDSTFGSVLIDLMHKTGENK